METEFIRACIRNVPDFPKPGVVFRDITPLLANAKAFSSTIDLLAARVMPYQPDAVVAIESRGFVFGAAIADRLDLPLQLVRKPGKLPHDKVSVSYELEYGEDTVEAHTDAIVIGKRYAIIDDLIATGGTAAATAQLIEEQQAEVACCTFVIELDFLHGRDKLARYPVDTLLQYETE